MKKLSILFLSVSMAILSGCGPSVRIFTDQDDSGTFEKYVTYSFLDFTEGNKKTITGIELERIRVAFARELEKKGLKFLEENGDVSVQITVYHRQSLDNYYYHPRRYSYMERSITVDMYDNHTRKHVWHCAAVGELSYDPAERADKLPEVVAKIFANYPV